MVPHRCAAALLCACLTLSSWPAAAASRKTPVVPGPLAPAVVVTVPGLPALPTLPPTAAAPVVPGATAPLPGVPAAAPAAPVAPLTAPGAPSPAAATPAGQAAAPVPTPAAVPAVGDLSALAQQAAPQAPGTPQPAAAASSLDAFYAGARPKGGAADAVAAPASKTKGGAPGLRPWLARGRAAAHVAAAVAPWLALSGTLTHAAGLDARSALGLAGFAFGAKAAFTMGKSLARFAKGDVRLLSPGLPLAVLLVGAAAGLAAATLAGWSPVVAAALVSVSLAGLAVHSGSLAPLAELASRRRGPAPMLKVWRSMGTQYLVLEPGQLGKPFLLTGGISRGLGEKGLSQPMPMINELVYFRVAGDQLELVAKHTGYRAEPGTPMALALDRSIPDSVLAYARIVTKDGLTGRVTASLDELLSQDLAAVRAWLEELYEAEYRLDEDATEPEAARAFPKNLELGSRLSFKRGGASVLAGDENQTPAGVDTHVTDLRRLDLTLRYSLSELPAAEGFEPRAADDRVGFFTTHFEDWSDDQKAELTKNLIQRWRLEKVYPSSPVSPVKRPIVFTMDPSVPVEYRAAVTRGVLAWNKAFEKLGFKDAVVVRDPPAGADYDLDDVRFNVIRYYLERDSGYAYAMMRVNPLTGEIFQGGIAISAKHARKPQGLDFKDIEELEDQDIEKPARTRKGHDHRLCGFAETRARELSWTLAILEARGGMTESQRRRYIDDYMTDLIVHEAGHVLGLRHNFMGKAWLTPDQLETAPQLTASVMDYYPVNIAAPGRRQGPYHVTDTGPYDDWAIEYGYRPLDGLSEKERSQTLSKIASRAAEPGLAYATDEDQVDLDPRMTRWTMGSDILEFAKGRMELMRELWGLLATRKPDPGEGYHGVYRSVVQSWIAYYRAARAAARFVGGRHFHRHHAGDPGGKLPFEPVPAATQRRALDLLAEKVFADAPFAVAPEVLRSLVPQRQATIKDDSPLLGYLPWEELVLRIRTEAVLDFLLEDEMLSKIRENRKLLAPGEDAFTMDELLERLGKAIWSEALAGPGAKRKKRTITPMRRQLQDAHVERLLALAYPGRHEELPEAATTARTHLRWLVGRIKTAQRVAGWDAASRAHLKEAAERITQAAEKYDP